MAVLTRATQATCRAQSYPTDSTTVPTRPICAGRIRSTITSSSTTTTTTTLALAHFNSISALPPFAGKSRDRHIARGRRHKHRPAESAQANRTEGDRTAGGTTRHRPSAFLLARSLPTHTICECHVVKLQGQARPDTPALGVAWRRRQQRLIQRRRLLLGQLICLAPSCAAAKAYSGIPSECVYVPWIVSSQGGPREGRMHGSYGCPCGGDAVLDRAA